MTIPDTALGISTGAIILGILRLIWVTRGYTDDIKTLKNQSHKPPCADVAMAFSEIEKHTLAVAEVIKTDLQDYKDNVQIKWDENAKTQTDLLLKVTSIGKDIEYLRTNGNFKPK